MSKTTWAVIANCMTILLSLPLGFLAMVGVGIAAGDVANIGSKVEPPALVFATAFATVVGFFAAITLPSWILIYFRKPRMSLVASAIPLLFVLLIIFYFRNV